MAVSREQLLCVIQDLEVSDLGSLMLKTKLNIEYS